MCCAQFEYKYNLIEWISRAPAMNIEQMQKMPITNIKQQQQQRRIYLSMYLIKMVQLFAVAIIIRLWLISSACKEFSAGNG